MSPDGGIAQAQEMLDHWSRLIAPGLLRDGAMSGKSVRFEDFQTGLLVSVAYVGGGVRTVQVGRVTVEGGSVRLGAATWVDWQHLESMQVLDEPGRAE